MDLESTKRLATDVVALGKKKGADTISSSIYESRHFTVAHRRGEVELLSEAGSSYFTAEVSRGQRSATVHSCDIGEKSIDRLLDEAMALAAHTEKDEFFTLPTEDELGSTETDLHLYDPEVADIPVERKIALAAEMERFALAEDGSIIPDVSEVETNIITVARANSIGFCGGYRKSRASISLSCAAEDRGSGENAGKRQSDHWFSSSVSWDGLDSAQHVAREAVRRVMRKLGAVKPKTQMVPVVFDPLTAASLVISLSSALNGHRVYQKLSYLSEQLNRKIGSPLLTMVDDPLMPGGAGSRPFDDEGVRSRKNILVQQGRLNSFLLSSYSANKMKMKTTGSSGGHSNLFLEAGTISPEEIIDGIDNGLYVTFLSGQGADVVTGDYSRGAQGLWIEHGKLSYPVNEFTIAGTFDSILHQLEQVGDDLTFNRSVVSPTIKVGEMTVSGS